MTQLRAVLEVARWEFQRYLKPKQQLVGMLITFVIGLAGYGVQQLAERGNDDVIEIAVTGAGVLPMDSVTGRLHFVSYEIGDPEMLRRFSAGEIGGLLRIFDTERAELVVRRSYDWVSDVRTALAAARQRVMLERTGIDAATLARIATPPSLEIEVQRSSRGARSSRLAATIIVALMMFAVFMGMSYVFASITGEKQIRVTEQVVSAIPAQSWIDGKILGLVGVSIVGVANTVIAMLGLLFVVMTLNDATLPIPDSLGDPAILLLGILFAMLGLFFWFAFLGAVAATIDDPQNSTRGSLLFVPLFATLLAFFIARDPDSGFARVLALLPPTAPSAMPARLLLTDVAPLEILASLLLLAAAVMGLRKAAGRIFRLGMLMYGKEPTWQELRRWVSGG